MEGQNAVVTLKIITGLRTNFCQVSAIQANWRTTVHETKLTGLLHGTNQATCGYTPPPKIIHTIQHHADYECNKYIVSTSNYN